MKDFTPVKWQWLKVTVQSDLRILYVLKYKQTSDSREARENLQLGICVCEQGTISQVSNQIWLSGKRKCRLTHVSTHYCFTNVRELVHGGKQLVGLILQLGQNHEYMRFLFVSCVEEWYCLLIAPHRTHVFCFFSGSFTLCTCTS